MVLLTRSLCRLAARPALSSPLFTSAARTSPILSRARHNNFNDLGSIRTLTGVREKVKVLLVLYDGKKHAEEVSQFSSIPFAQSIE
jgi:formate dehydrogenase